MDEEVAYRKIMRCNNITKLRGSESFYAGLDISGENL
jgi:hypothetical protein